MTKVLSGNLKRDIVANAIILGSLSIGLVWQGGSAIMQTPTTSAGRRNDPGEAKLIEIKPADRNNSLARPEDSVDKNKQAQTAIEQVPLKEAPPAAQELAKAQTTQAPVPTMNAESKLLSSVQLDRNGRNTAPRPMSANPIERNPQPVRDMSPQKIEETIGAYFHWKDNEKLSIALDFGEVTAAELDSVVAGYVIRSETANNWMYCRPGDLPRAVESMPGKLLGNLPPRKWTPEVHARASQLYGPGARVDVKLVLADTTTLEMFRQLAAANERGSAATRDFTFKLKAADKMVTIELLAQTWRNP